MNSISLSKIDELFTYDGEKLLWKNTVKYGSHRKAGDPAGSIANNGYLRIGLKIDGVKRMYTVHRIIYQIANRIDNLCESAIIDHIDCNPMNNSKENLREVTRSQNSLNARVRKDNTTGYKNIIVETISKTTGDVINYRVSINFMKKNYLLFSPTIEEAVRKRDELMCELYFDYARSESGKLGA